MDEYGTKINVRKTKVMKINISEKTTIVTQKTNYELKNLNI